MCWGHYCNQFDLVFHVLASILLKSKCYLNMIKTWIHFPKKKGFKLGQEHTKALLCTPPLYQSVDQTTSTQSRSPVSFCPVPSMSSKYSWWSERNAVDEVREILLRSERNTAGEVREMRPILIPSRCNIRVIYSLLTLSKYIERSLV